MPVRSKLTIYNAALTRTGNRPVTEGDGSDIWNALEANYDEIVRAAFEGQEYPFGRARVTLTARADGDFGYEDAFTLPNDVIHVHDVFIDDISADNIHTNWDIDGENNRLLISARNREVEVEYLKRGLEHTWSGQFALGIQRKLEAVIKDVLEEFEESSAKDSDADFQLLNAGRKASNNRSERKFRKGGRLIDAHRSQYGSRRPYDYFGLFRR